MPVFQPRTRKQILRQLVARTIARSKLIGLEKSSSLFHLLAAFAAEVAEVYFQIARLRDVFSIDKATGSDLDKRAAEIQPATITRRDAQYGTTVMRYTRATTVGTLPIPTGAIVAARDAEGEIRFRTTAPGSIIPGQTTSADIPVQALERGDRSNVSAGAINIPITQVLGVVSVTNPAACTNGRAREKDPEFRARLKAFIASLARGTVPAIESAALSFRSPSGARVLFAKVVEPLPRNGTIKVYIDDGTGTVETFNSDRLASPETVVASAAGGEQDLQIMNWPIRDDGSFVLRLGGVPLVRGVEYELDASVGRVWLITALTPTQSITAEYRYYTGLIQAAQKVISGIRGSRQLFGVRAAGIQATVLPPARVLQTVVANVTVADGFDVNATIELVATAIQSYINGLNIGAAVLVAEIIEAAMSVPGVYDFQLTSLTGSAPATNQVILPSQVARAYAAGIILS